MNNYSNYNPNQMMLENLNETGNDNSFNNMMQNGSMTNNMMTNNMMTNNMMGGSNTMMSNNMMGGSDNILSMSNNLDSISLGMQNLNPYNKIDLNGTALNDLSNGANSSDNSSLIKSLTKEIISNLKDSNIDLSEERLSKKDDTDSESESSFRRKKKKKSKSVKEELQDYVEDKNPVQSTNKYLSMIFDESFDIKDFFLLLGIYFLLSQNMIKDFFGKYFTCLNPDDEGKVHVQGVIVYGLILTILYMLLKKLI